MSDLRHTMVVVAAEHRHSWAAELFYLPAENIIAQPCNRGTACGVLLPLMQVVEHDPTKGARADRTALLDSGL